MTDQTYKQGRDETVIDLAYRREQAEKAAKAAAQYQLAVQRERGEIGARTVRIPVLGRIR